VGDVHDRVHVPGACRRSMATTIPLWAAMAVEQRRATRTAATLAPRRDRSRTACWYAKRARPTAEGGRHRDGDARPCWLAGKATYREGYYILHCTARPQPDEPAACCRGMAAVSHFAGLHTRPGLYLRWTKETSGRCSHAGSVGVRTLLRVRWRGGAGETLPKACKQAPSRRG
jgi:hypothetical protein